MYLAGRHISPVKQIVLIKKTYKKRKREKQQEAINILKGDNLAVSEQRLDT